MSKIYKQREKKRYREWEWEECVGGPRTKTQEKEWGRERERKRERERGMRDRKLENIEPTDRHSNKLLFQNKISDETDATKIYLFYWS